MDEAAGEGGVVSGGEAGDELRGLLDVIPLVGGDFMGEGKFGGHLGVNETRTNGEAMDGGFGEGGGEGIGEAGKSGLARGVGDAPGAGADGGVAAQVYDAARVALYHVFEDGAGVGDGTVEVDGDGLLEGVDV